MVAKIDIDALKFKKIIKNKWYWKSAKNQKQPVSTLELLLLKKNSLLRLDHF